MGIAGRHDARVGRADGAGGRVFAARQVLEGDEALPVVGRIPARHGGAARDLVGGIADRHAAGGDVADAAGGVGHHHVLHGHHVAAHVRDVAVDGAHCRVDHAGGDGGVVVGERGPLQRCDVAGRQHRVQTAVEAWQHGTMARAPALDRAFAHAFDLDGHGLDRERPVAVGRQILARLVRVDLLDEQVLHVGAGVGEAPGHRIAAPEHDQRHAGERGADHVGRRRVRLPQRQMREVPDRGGAQLQVRIVGEQRLARGRACAGHHPVVGSGGAEQIIDQRGSGVFLGAVRAAQRIELGDFGQRRRRIGGIQRHQVFDLRRRQALRGKRQPADLVVEVGAELQGHHLDRDDAVGRPPRLGPIAQQQEFRRQARLQPAGAALHVGIDAAGVGFQHLP